MFLELTMSLDPSCDAGNWNCSVNLHRIESQKNNANRNFVLIFAIGLRERKQKLHNLFRMMDSAWCFQWSSWHQLNASHDAKKNQHVFSIIKSWSSIRGVINFHLMPAHSNWPATIKGSQEGFCLMRQTAECTMTSMRFPWCLMPSIHIAFMSTTKKHCCTNASQAHAVETSANTTSDNNWKVDNSLMKGQ